MGILSSAVKLGKTVSKITDDIPIENLPIQPIKKTNIVPLTPKEQQSLSADFQRVTDSSVRDDPDVFKNILSTDDEYAQELLAELRSPTRDITGDPAKLSEVKSLRNEIYSLTQKALKDFPDEITVYRYGKLNEEDGISSFTLNPEFKNPWKNLPQSTPRQRELATNKIETYTVKKSDILAAPNLVRDFGESEVIIKNSAVKKNLEFNKGGTPMLEEQMELFNEGGLKDEGGEVDPESGNDVPIGSTKKEVRDDIPAMLSEGEFVFPADVVRYIGLEKLMELRQAAKMGLKKMEAMGQMGNSEEATIPDDMPFDMADLIIVAGDKEDEPKEMAEGGLVYAQQGTFVPNFGIAGTRPSVFDQRVTPSYTPPPSSIAPTPISAPAGGYRPKFINQQTPSTQQNPIDTIIQSDQVSANTTNVTSDDEPFFETVEDVYTTKEYINPETGERRTFSFYQGNPITSIPDGFIPVEDYKTDETTTTDLESTSVETTQVRDDKSGTKQRLEDMVRQQSGNKLSELKGKVAEGDTQSVIDAYLQNEKTKALMSSLGIINPIAGLAGRGAAEVYSRQLENLMKENGIEIPEVEAGFIENLKGAVSDIFAGADEQPEIYQPIFKPQDSPLSTVPNATNLLSSNEAKAYDNAVKSNNANVATHYEIINNRLNKMSDFMAAGGKEGGAPTSGLSTYDIDQAEKQFEKGTGTKLGDSVNKAEAAKKAAAEKAAADKAARDKRKKYQKEQREKQQKQNEDFTKKKLKQFKETGKVTGFKEGGLASRKK